MDKKERLIYEAPYTKRCQVELEGGICVSSQATPGDNVIDSDSGVNISEQKHEGWELGTNPNDVIEGTWK